jgi:tetratricopeptide (TPR) repeat protein
MLKSCACKPGFRSLFSANGARIPILLLVISFTLIRATKLVDAMSTNSSFLQLIFLFSQTGRMAGGFSLSALREKTVGAESIGTASAKYRLLYQSAVSNFPCLSPWCVQRFYFCRGMLRLNAGSYQASAADFAKSLDIRSDDAIARFQLGYALGELGQWEEMFRAWDIAGASVRVGRFADRCEELGQWAFALRAYSYLAHQKGDKLTWQRAYLIALEKQGDADAAVKLAVAATQVFPNDALFHVDVGRAYQKTGNLELAKHWYESAAGTDPKSDLPDLYSAILIMTESDGGKSTGEDAHRYLLRALGKNAQNDLTYWWLATYSLAIGDYDRSASYAQQAVSVRQSQYNVAFYHQHLASVYSAMGRDDCASYEYQQFLAIDPSNPVIHSRLNAATKRMESLSREIRSSPCRYRQSQ